MKRKYNYIFILIAVFAFAITITVPAKAQVHDTTNTGGNAAMVMFGVCCWDCAIVGVDGWLLVG